MNRPLAACLLAGTLTIIAACDRGGSTTDGGEATEAAARPAPTPEALAAATPISYRVEGMHCGGCAAGLQEKLAGLKGVVACEVSYENSRADISVTDDSIAPSLEEAIESLGYTFAAADDAPADVANPDATPPTAPETDADAAASS